MTFRFQEKGGNVVEQKIKDLKEFQNFDVVVNCLGLGAKEICNDLKLIPIRGQVLKVSDDPIRLYRNRPP